MEIEASAESAICAVQDCHFGLGIGVKGQESGVQFACCGGVYSVAAVRAGEGYECDAWVRSGGLDGVGFGVDGCSWRHCSKDPCSRSYGDVSWSSTIYFVDLSSLAGLTEVQYSVIDFDMTGACRVYVCDEHLDSLWPGCQVCYIKRCRLDEVTC